MTLEKVPYIVKLVLPRRRTIMSAGSFAPTRRNFLATSVAASAFGLLLLAAASYAQTVLRR